MSDRTIESSASVGTGIECCCVGVEWSNVCGLGRYTIGILGSLVAELEQRSKAETGVAQACLSFLPRDILRNMSTLDGP
jgi:hypothetical protein